MPDNPDTNAHATDNVSDDSYADIADATLIDTSTVVPNAISDDAFAYVTNTFLDDYAALRRHHLFG